MTLIDIARAGTLEDLQGACASDSCDINERDEDKNTPILVAIKRNYPDMIIALASNGADVSLENIYDETPLIAALKYSTVEMAGLLVEFGAEVNQQTSKGNTALISLSLTREYQAIEFLLSSGADTEIKNINGMGAMAAVILQKYDSAGIMQLLLDAGADATVDIEIGNVSYSTSDLAMEKKKYSTYQVLTDAQKK
jgi:ankyrin repeat protein